MSDKRDLWSWKHSQGSKSLWLPVAVLWPVPVYRRSPCGLWQSRLAFPGKSGGCISWRHPAIHRSSLRLSGCPAPLQPATSLVLGAEVINGVSEGLWLWSNEGETACPFQSSHKPPGPLPESMVILQGSQKMPIDHWPLKLLPE